MLIVTVAVFFLILSVLVLIHELGHFLAAKKFGIKVEEFGFGLPPRIFGKKIGETIYSINYLPIGGFVKLYGEEGEETGKKNAKDENRAFYKRNVWQRCIVIIAGVLMNFILAVVVISYLFTQGVMVPTNNVRIEKVLADSPAEKSGLASGDIIRKMILADNTEIQINSSDKLISTAKDHLGEEIVLLIERVGNEKSFKITPRRESPVNEGPMGIAISNFELKKYSLLEAPVKGLGESLKLSWELARGIGITLYKLVTLQPVAKDVAGPIGIAQMTGEAVKFGSGAILELLGLLSLNLAIVNILPFPALDGGRLLFVVIEGFTGKRIKTHWERYIHQIGMAILLALILLVTVNDLLRIFSKV